MDGIHLDLLYNLGKSHYNHGQQVRMTTLLSRLLSDNIDFSTLVGEFSRTP